MKKKNENLPPILSNHNKIKTKVIAKPQVENTNLTLINRRKKIINEICLLHYEKKVPKNWNFFLWAYSPFSHKKGANL